MFAIAPSLLALALCFSLASPVPPGVPQQSKKIYVGNLPFSASDDEVRTVVRVEEGDPAPRRVAFQSEGRFMSPIRLSGRGAEYGGKGRTPAGRSLQAIRIWSEAGVLTLRLGDPPADQGWDEGVAAARYHYEPTDGEAVRGEAVFTVEIEGGTMGFNIGMPPSFRWAATD